MLSHKGFLSGIASTCNPQYLTSGFLTDCLPGVNIFLQLFFGRFLAWQGEREYEPTEPS
jgi:hypothetical protein